MDWKECTDAAESRRKRRKVTPDSKVRVVNELELGGKDDSESDSNGEQKE